MDIASLERELRDELEKFDHIFERGTQGEQEIDHAPQQQFQFNRRNGPRTLSAFELAQAEGDRECLEDRLDALTKDCEEKEKGLVEFRSKVAELTNQNAELQRNNDLLQFKLSQLSRDKEVSDEDIKHSSIDQTTQAQALYGELEHRLSETRAQLKSAQSKFLAQAQAQEAIEKELSAERIRRMHAEKERDAYALAYEVSLKHFEKWTQKKQLHKSKQEVKS